MVFSVFILVQETIKCPVYGYTYVHVYLLSLYISGKIFSFLYIYVTFTESSFRQGDAPLVLSLSVGTVESPGTVTWVERRSRTGNTKNDHKDGGTERHPTLKVNPSGGMGVPWTVVGSFVGEIESSGRVVRSTGPL